MSSTERKRYEFETDRDEFDDWISRGSIGVLADRETIEVETLADLVDIAIDSDRRVIEDGRAYAVFVEDLAYRYHAPAMTALGATEAMEEAESIHKQEESYAPDAEDT